MAFDGFERDRCFLTQSSFNNTIQHCTACFAGGWQRQKMGSARDVILKCNVTGSAAESSVPHLCCASNNACKYVVSLQHHKKSAL